MSAPAVTHPEQVVFPQDGITKGEVVEYYDAVAPAMVRHLRDRPLMLERFPNGIGTAGFIQKDLDDPPASVRTVEVPKEGGTVCHGIADRTVASQALANFGTLVFHPWLSRADRLDHPDQLIFDLDPPGDDFRAACTAALALGEVLDELGLVPFVKTTGKRGLHVVAPLDRRAGFDVARGFARDVADLVAARHLERLTTAVRKEKRGGRLFVDTLRNGYAQTAVAPYSLRAVVGAPVATPLEWDELTDADCHAIRYTLVDVPKRLEEVGDPWASMTRRARSLAGPRGRLDAVQTGMSTRRS